ncbi:MAG TPA: rod shape-determining protein RodA [Kiritimatiellia bacterium]|nr:rod shape-determining protein RodA [Kiritimatiellia bacterium]
MSLIRFDAIRRIDPLFLLGILALVVVGFFFVYSASYRGDEDTLTTMTRLQIRWASLGLILFLLTVKTDYRNLQGTAPLIYFLCLVLLVLVLVMGVKISGAYRWLSLMGVRIQPSEFAKLGVLLMLAAYLGQPGRDMRSVKTLVTVLLLAGIPFALILQQPDLGTAMMLVPMAFVMLFIAGVPIRYLLVMVGIGILLMPLGWFLLDDYQHERILVFFDPGRDPRGAGWNKIQSEIAVGSGGLTGKGFLMGTQNILGFLPRTVAPTDFIFSVIAEEAGFLGSVGVILLYAVLLTRGLRAGIRSRDVFGRLLCAGMVTLLFGHVFVNMAMTIGLMPITGLPLPLISYGGSFMICTMIGLGLIQSVYARRLPR